MDNVVKLQNEYIWTLPDLYEALSRAEMAETIELQIHKYIALINMAIKINADPAENSGPVDDKPVTGMPPVIYAGNTHASEDGKFQCGEWVNNNVGGEGCTEYRRADLVQPSSEGVKEALYRLKKNYAGFVGYNDFENSSGAKDIAIIEAALSNSVPDGMVMVPREPTEAMKNAGHHAFLDTKNEQWQDMTHRVFNAMIAAHESEGGK